MASFTPHQCLTEHLNYFNESIALDGDFDDIFHKDFELIFDPSEPTFELPNGFFSEHQEQPHQQQQPVPQKQALPMNVLSNHDVQPTPVTSNSFALPADTPAMAPAMTKPVFQSHAPIETGNVSPTSVATSVFEMQLPSAQPKASAPKSSVSTVTSSAPRKRSFTSMSSEPASTDSGSVSVSESNLSFQEQEDLRRERNRHHAKKSRQRKRNYMQQLEEAVNDMRKENERLFKLLDMDNAASKAKLAQDEARKEAESTERFIAALKIPRNRVLDNTTHAFLKELWK